MSLDLQRVLISDPVDDKCVELLKKYGIKITRSYKLSKEELITRLEDHDGLIVRSETQVTAEVIEAAPSLRVIGRAGTGVDNIDVPAATNRGILVLNTPGGNSVSACELTCAMILALARNVIQAGQSMREGRWDRKLYAGHELQDKCLGVLGYGRIGREVGRRMQAFGMRVVAYDPLLDDAQARELGVDKAEVDELLAQADYISVHTPLLPHTRDLLNANNMLNTCKPGFYVINVARGGIISESGLLEALESGRCAGAALDVFTEEPPRCETLLRLLRHPRVIATPHLGASTAEAQMRVAVEMAEQLLAASGRETSYRLTGVVNAPLYGTVAAAGAEGTAWLELARHLGHVAMKFLVARDSLMLSRPVPAAEIADVRDIAGTTFELAACPPERRAVVRAGILLGLLAVKLGSEPNLVGVEVLVEKHGLRIEMGAEDAPGNETDRLRLRLRLDAIRGCCEIVGSVSSGAILLLGVDDSKFGDCGIIMNPRASYALHRAEKPKDLGVFVKELEAADAAIESVNVAGSWILVQTKGKEAKNMVANGV